MKILGIQGKPGEEGARDVQPVSGLIVDSVLTVWTNLNLEDQVPRSKHAGEIN